MSETKDRILEHALAVLSENDFESLTMKDIASGLGLSSGSMFHAYPSKNSLLASCFSEGIRRYHDSVITAIAQEREPVSALRSFVSTHLLWVESNAGLARILFTSLPNEVEREAKDMAATTNHGFFEALRGMSSTLVSDGAMGEISLRLAHPLAIGPSQE